MNVWVELAEENEILVVGERVLVKGEALLRILQAADAAKKAGELFVGAAGEAEKAYETAQIGVGRHEHASRTVFTAAPCPKHQRLYKAIKTWMEEKPNNSSEPHWSPKGIPAGRYSISGDRLTAIPVSQHMLVEACDLTVGGDGMPLDRDMRSICVPLGYGEQL